MIMKIGRYIGSYVGSKPIEHRIAVSHISKLASGMKKLIKIFRVESFNVVNLVLQKLIVCNDVVVNEYE